MNMPLRAPLGASPVIAKGPHAGQPQPVIEQMLDQAHQIKAVIVKLKRNGFEVIGAMTSIGLAPTIQVASGREADNLIETGQAAYYKYSMDAAGIQTRHGQFQVDGVRIVWCERGAPGVTF